MSTILNRGLDTTFTRDLLKVIQEEQNERWISLRQKSPDYAEEIWSLKDGPFVQELCILLLVALYHQVERKLVDLVAQLGDGNVKVIEWAEYRNKVRKIEGKGTRVEELARQLGAESIDSWFYVETLRELANSYKHREQPKGTLLDHLEEQSASGEGALAPERYLRVSESPGIVSLLAKSVGLPADAGPIQVVEGFLDRAEIFVDQVIAHKKERFAKVKPGMVTIGPEEFML